ncbi:MAG: glycosyltransferase family 1 protein [Vicinamibacterales bacterium]
MRIGIDARELSGTPTGVGRYLAGLLREWTASQHQHGHDLVLYAHRPLDFGTGCDVRVLPGSGGTSWEQRTLPAAIAGDRLDILFSPAYSTPLLTRVPRVVALHDISFVARPDWFRWREGVRRRWLARRSAAAARAVVTISEFSKREIVERMRVDPGHVHVIPPGIDAPPAATAGTGAHVLYVGSIFNRRHIPDLIAAFSIVASRHADAHLHLVGDDRSFPSEHVGALVARSPHAARIHWHRYIPDAELQTLYSQARAFAFLSEYEGLGLTPMEAIAAGIPALLLDTAVARESCGDAALYVARGAIGETASRLELLLYDEATRARLLAEAPRALGRYDWARAGRDTLRLLESVA